jgi:hypothetical protein
MENPNNENKKIISKNLSLVKMLASFGTIALLTFILNLLFK